MQVSQQGIVREIAARKVVLATVKEGFGRANIPSFIEGLPKGAYAHTSERIAFAQLKGKRVGIVGVGASAFDAAAVALEHGAGSIEM